MTKRLRLSATTSSLREGRCAMSTGVFLSFGDRYMTPSGDRPGAGLSGDPPLSAGRTMPCERSWEGLRKGCKRCRGKVCRGAAPAAYLTLSVLRVELDDQL